MNQNTSLYSPGDPSAKSAPVEDGPLISSVSDNSGLERQLGTMQHEIERLQVELNLLRRRDETLNFYMQQLDEEMRLAARLQQDFLPKTLPRIGSLRFHTLFRPAGYVSGDLYDVMRLDEEHIGFFVADAVGHGMPAALLTMFIKRALVTKEIHEKGYRLLSPGEAMSRLNGALVEQNLSQVTFCTALYGIINTRTQEAVFARGGHPNPILLPHKGDPANLETDGGLLGIFPDDQYAEKRLRLNRGDRLFIYTDGLEVAFSRDQTADTSQWRSELHARRDLKTEDLLNDLGHHLDHEAGSLMPKDDLTMIVVEAA